MCECTGWKQQLLVPHDNREYYCSFFFRYCSNGLLNLPIHIQLRVWKPFLLWKVFSLWTAYHVSGCKLSEYRCSVWKDLFSSWTETFHPEERFLVLDGGSGRRKQMLVLEHRQPKQETKDLNCAHEQRGRNVCFLDVAFKWRESYKKHTSRTEPQSQGQRPVRRAHVQYRSFLGTIIASLHLSFRENCHNNLKIFQSTILEIYF